MACVLSLLAVTACEKDEVKVTAEFGAPPVLTATSTNAGTLTLANQGNPALTYNWTPYTVNVSDNAKVASTIAYTLQIARAGTNFATVREFSATAASTTSLAFTVGQLNTALLALNFPFGQPARIEARLKTIVAGNLSPLYSAVQTLVATPYDACVAPTTDTWSIIGPAGIDWSTDIPLTWNCTDNAYVVRRVMNAGEFKFRRNNDWTINLGGAGTTSAPLVIGATTSLATGNPPNLQIATAGTYTLKLRVTGSGTTTAGTLTITQ